MGKDPEPPPPPSEQKAAAPGSVRELLKDAARRRAELKAREDAYEEDRRKLESRLRRTRRLQRVIELVPAGVTLVAVGAFLLFSDGSEKVPQAAIGLYFASVIYILARALQREEHDRFSPATSDVVAKPKRARDGHLESLKEERRSRKIEEELLQRLRQRVAQIHRLGWTYLTVAGVTTAFAVSFLAYTFWKTDDWSVDSRLIAKLVVRGTVALMVEGFAIYFLRLYGGTIHEQRFHTNELTTIESKLLALHAASERSEVSSIDDAIRALHGTDRNSTIKMGETTADVERVRSGAEEMKAAAEALCTVAKALKG